MGRSLKLRLRVIIPAVENSISGTSFRPRDVYVSRKGISVEIGNTDAEGRLILADALALADEDKPALIVDFATLTGAARVALGPDVPPFFTDDDLLADQLMHAGAAENDPLWRMPLWRPYETMLDSKVADLNNVATGGHGRRRRRDRECTEAFPPRSSECLPWIESITHRFADEDQQRQHQRNAEKAGKSEPRRLNVCFALRQQFSQGRRAGRQTETEKVKSGQRHHR